MSIPNDSIDMTGEPGPEIASFYEAFEPFAAEHPLAQVDAFHRFSGEEIGVRIIDPDFEGVPWKARTECVWRILHSAPGELADRVSILVVMTPDEVEKAYVTSVEFDEGSSGPVSFRDQELVFRNRIECHQVFVTVSRPFLENLQRSSAYCAAIKFDHPPGIMATDDDQLSVDIGQTLRDDNYHVRWFETVEQARDAAFEAARQSLARIAAA